MRLVPQVDNADNVYTIKRRGELASPFYYISDS